MENLVGYAKTDLVIPSCDGWTSLAQANADARDWCAEVNGKSTLRSLRSLR